MDRQGEDILLRMTTIIKKYDPSFTKIKATATGFFCRNKSGNIFFGYKLPCYKKFGLFYALSKSYL